MVMVHKFDCDQHLLTQWDESLIISSSMASSISEVSILQVGSWLVVRRERGARVTIFTFQWGA